MPEEDMIGDTDGRNVFIDLEHYRRLVRINIDMRRYKTALFWAEKVCTISQYNSKDIYWLAQCMFYLKEYHRAVHIVKLRSLEKTDIFCHYITVECLLEAKEYTEASELLNSVVCEDLMSSTTIDNSYDFKQQYQQRGENGEPSKIDILASIYYLKGKVLEAMDNRGAAMDCYIQALQYSVYCTEALDALVQHEMLMAVEENQLMSNLHFDQQCSKVDGEIIKKLYETKLKKYYKTPFPQLINSEQTPIGSLNTLKSMRKLTDRMKGVEQDDSNVPIKFVNSRLVTPLRENDLSPVNQFLYDVKSTPTHSLCSSLKRLAQLENSINNNKIGANDSNRNTDFNKTTKQSSASTSITKPQELININLVNERLQFSLDMKISTAENLFYNCEYKKSMNLLESILKMDPYHTKSVTVLIGCLVELKECNKLFYLAHKLVDLYADQAISWYAVGCYYDLIGKSDQARRFLSKSTTLDRLFGPAWLAYGHSFAKENEHDQAMAAYFKATQLMRGCHLPLLYIGVECGLTKNLELAEKFFFQAMSIAPLDVYVLHELGVIKFEYEFYESAEEVLRATLDIVEEMANKNNDSISPTWEPLLNNIGHCCRKNKKYKEALHFHQFALLLKPQTPSTFTAIGFAQSLMGKYDDAIESLHKSLALKRDDIFTSTLLKYCMEDLLDDDNIFLDMNVPPKDILTNSKSTIKINVTSPASPKNLNLINLDTPYKLKSQKLKFDDNDSSNATPFNYDDDSSGVDMSMDL